jgi:hypothetical protein
MTDNGSRTCPFCQGQINASAMKCLHCGEWVEAAPQETALRPRRARLGEQAAAVPPMADQPGGPATAVLPAEAPPRVPLSFEQPSVYDPRPCPAANPPAPTLVPASQNQRFLTLVLDTVFCRIFSFMFGFAMGVMGLGQFILDMNLYVLGAVIFLAYYSIQEAFCGRTLGKWIMGTKVVSLNGAAPSLSQVLLRSLCRFIPFEALSFLGQKRRPRGWHDRIPNTMVISVRHP